MTGVGVHQKNISNKKVLLVADSSVLGKEAILHGLSLSNRMDASLEVLHLLTPETADLAAQSFAATMEKLNLAEQVGYYQLLGDKDFTREAIEYAKNRRNLLCVILCPKGIGVPGKGKRQKKFKEVSKVLSCPVVLYTDNLVYL